jgi:chromosomal replication initiator protein
VIRVADIQRVVAEHYGLPVRVMKEPGRRGNAPNGRAYARERQVAMLLSSRLTSHSLSRIGDLFGGRDHSTIFYGVRKIERLVGEDKALKHDVETLECELVSKEHSRNANFPQLPQQVGEKVSFVSFSASA